MRISDWSSDVCSSDLPAAVVAAGGNGIEQRVMQPPDDRPQTAFQHPMKLEGLARRDTQGVAAMCASKFVELQPLCRAAHSTRQTPPDHELISGFQLLAPAFVATLAVIMLISTGAIKTGN